MDRGRQSLGIKPIWGMQFLLCILVAGMVLAGLLLWSPAPAQACDFPAEEIAFVQLLNDYRVSYGLEPLLVSDMVSEACYRHNSDMGKYRFFSHTTTNGSDWFDVGDLPWDRMAVSGYSADVEGENIAAGYTSAASVFAAWKASPGHNANMLRADYKVLGISFIYVEGSTYGYYWTTDFGSYVDPTAHTVGAVRYEQTYSRLAYGGTWYNATSSAASGGSYRYTNSGGSKVIVDFDGTGLALIAKKSPAYGKAKVTLDGRTPVYVDLYSPSTLYKQNIYGTGTLADENHTLTVEWAGAKNASSSGYLVTLDAVYVAGIVNEATSTFGGIVFFEQTDSRLAYAGSWYNATSSAASGRSYRYANSPGSMVKVDFYGTGLALFAKKSPSYGKAKVTLDDRAPVYVDLYSPSTLYRQNIYGTGTLVEDNHSLTIEWAGSKNARSSGYLVTLDVMAVAGTLNQATTGGVTCFQQNDNRLAYAGSWSKATASAASGGSYNYANSSGSTVTIDFSGTGLALIAKKSPDAGIAKLTLDGGTEVYLDLYSPSVLHQQNVYGTGTLADTDHTLIIEWYGDKNVLSSGYLITVDAVYVAGTLK